MINKIIDKLMQVKGLANFKLLTESQKEKIKEIVEPRNIGVQESLKREFTLLLTHDSTFRPPTTPEVIQEEGQVIFPPVPFPEVEAKDVVSSSPSEQVHNFLVKEFNLELKDEATLLIGFNLLLRELQGKERERDKFFYSTSSGCLTKYCQINSLAIGTKFWPCSSTN